MYPLFVVPQTAHRHGLVSTLGACATLVSLALPMLAQEGSGWGRGHNHPRQGSGDRDPTFRAEMAPDPKLRNR